MPPTISLRPGIAEVGAVVWLMALFAVVSWAGTPIATKIATAHLDGLTVGAFRTLLAGAACLPLLLVPGPRPVGREQRLLVLFTALGGPVGFTLLFSLGQARTSAVHASLIIAAAPIFTGLIGSLTDRVKPHWRWYAGAAVAMVGESWLVLGRGGEGGATLPGDLLVLAGVLCAAVGYVAGGRLSRSYPPLRATLWAGVVGAAIVLPICAAKAPGLAWSTVPPQTWLAMAYLALLSSLVAYVAWYAALARGGFVRVGAMQFLTPVVAMILAAAVLAEPVTLPMILAGVLVLGGVVLCRRS